MKKSLLTLVRKQSWFDWFCLTLAGIGFLILAWSYIVRLQHYDIWTLKQAFFAQLGENTIGASLLLMGYGLYLFKNRN